MNLEEEIVQLLKEVNNSIRYELELVKKSKSSHETKLTLLENNLTALKEKLESYIVEFKEHKHVLDTKLNEKKILFNDDTIKLLIYLLAIILAVLGIKINL